jgi:hypothetical protein
LGFAIFAAAAQMMTTDDDAILGLLLPRMWISM